MAEEKTTVEKQEIPTIDGCLPQDLTIEILLRLPVKSLVRFKLACKSWSTLISSYSFAQSHLQLNNPASLLFVRGKRSAFSSNFHLQGVRDSFGSSVVIEGDITPLPSGSKYIMGLSHGLVCIKGANNLIRVFNPTTKECRNIQFPCMTCYVVGCGFGFVPSIDDYKVVLLARCSEPSMSSNYRVYVFSSREGQWRELDGSGTAFDALVDYPRNQSIGLIGGAAHAALWNEAFYWVVPVGQGFSLLKFDIIREKFSRMSELEASWGYKYTASICVTEHNNLCVCRLTRLRYIEMWMLETEYADWKLKLRFQPQCVQYVLGSTSNGYVFTRFWDGRREQFMLIDTNQQRPTYHLVTQKGFMYAASFTASLISPHYSRQGPYSVE